MLPAFCPYGAFLDALLDGSATRLPEIETKLPRLFPPPWQLYIIDSLKFSLNQNNVKRHEKFKQFPNQNQNEDTTLFTILTFLFGFITERATEHASRSGSQAEHPGHP